MAAVIVMIVAGELLAVLLQPHLSSQMAKGLSFFLVFLVFYAFIAKRARYGLLVSLGWCLLAGLLALIGEWIWPGW